MKHSILFLYGILIVMLAHSQQPIASTFPKTITVSGSAEMEIIPDEIFVQITLKEYQKRGEAKKDLDNIKSDFLKACREANIADTAISIAFYTGYNNYFFLRKKKKDPNLMASITYQLKFSNSKQMDELVDKLDDEATQTSNIVSTSHSRMTEFRRILKTQAIKSARDKGAYLTEAINEKLGEAITITEPAEPSFAGNVRGVNAVRSQAVYGFSNNYESNSGQGSTAEVDFKKIKLRFEVAVSLL